MIDLAHVADIGPDEIVARYILFSKHFRPGNQTVKADALMPPPNLRLSVTRHLMASETELWQIRQKIAADRNLTLYGRGDISVGIIRIQHLEVLPDPTNGNPNHSNVQGWPAEKHEQKLIAQELAKEAAFRPTPAQVEDAPPAESPAPVPAPNATENPGPAGQSASWLARCVPACWRFIRRLFRKESG